MGKPPRVTLNGSQSARDQWPPIPQLHCTGIALHTVYLSTCRHPRGVEIAPDLLKPIPLQARERGNYLMKMDHGDGFAFHFLTAGIRLYYSQSSPLSSSSQTGPLRRLCTCFSLGFSGVLGHMCVAVQKKWKKKAL